jgi:WhiB family transcriptional regulator, redox-sensing transcriptional regulator
MPSLVQYLDAARPDFTNGPNRPACDGLDTDLWYPDQGNSYACYEQARRICYGCPVRVACLQFAVDTDQRFGLWGGMTPRERNRLRRQRAA